MEQGEGDSWRIGTGREAGWVGPFMPRLVPCFNPRFQRKATCAAQTVYSEGAVSVLDLRLFVGTQSVRPGGVVSCVV